jgi:outer membrane protein
LLLVFVSPAVAVEGIAVVDYQSIFDQYEGTTDAQKTLDREVKEWEKQMADLREEIETLTREIESQKLMLSEDRLREKQAGLERKREEYERFAQDVFGVDGRASRRNAELTTPIAEKILDVIAKIAGERGLDIVLDAGTGGVVWAKDDVNITQFILEDLRISVPGAAAPDPGETSEQRPPSGGQGGGGE